MGYGIKIQSMTSRYNFQDISFSISPYHFYVFGGRREGGRGTYIDQSHLVLFDNVIKTNLGGL